MKQDCLLLSGALCSGLFILSGCTVDPSPHLEPIFVEDAAGLPDSGPDAANDDDASTALDANFDTDADADTEGGLDPTDADASPGPCIDYQSLRAELLATIEEAECTPESCPMVDVVAEGAEARATSLGKRILLIDDMGVVVPAATRYRQRTLAYVAMTPHGIYEEVQPSFSISRDALTILHKLDMEAPSARASELEIDDAFFGKFVAHGLPAALDGHGTDLLPFLAEHVPDSQFVVSDTPARFPRDCALLLPGAEAEPAWDALSNFVDNLTLSLSSIIERYEVHALHLSWGLDHDNLADGFEVACNATASRAVTTRIMRLYANLFRALTALETAGADGRMQGVVLFQAGEAATDGVPAEDTLDCTDVPRRVRSYSVAYDGYAVPPEGSYDYALLPQVPAGKNLECNDVFMVMGYRSYFAPPRAGAYFSHRPLGLGTHRPAWPPASSFSNPIALAHYFLGQANAPDADTEAWIDWLTRDASRPILDPLLHEAFPAGGLNACP